MTRFALPALLALALGGTGCVRFDYTRTLRDEPVPEEKMELLEEGKSLQACLDELGAPAYVWSDPRGVWMAYIWVRQRGPRFSVSLPSFAFGLPGPSPSLTYSDIKRRGEGMTLCFDPDLNLRFARRGLTDLPADLDP
ncbi:MAG: hypothetical protein AAGD14_15420 [Planctomycetota bacterium]